MADGISAHLLCLVSLQQDINFGYIQWRQGKRHVFLFSFEIRKV